MSIGVEGSYLFQFSLDGKRDFIEESELVSFQLVEEAGNVLPTFALAFKTRDAGIYRSLNENKTFEVAFGRDTSGLTAASLAVVNFDDQPAGDNYRLITVTGLYAALPYLSSSKLFVSPLQSGIECVRSIASRYFTVQGNATKSLDSQRWVQPNHSDRAFINDVYMHSDLGNSFPAIGISSDGRFIVKDVKAELRNDYKWRFITQGRESRDIVYDADPYVRVINGFMNSWVGYGREKLVYGLEGATETSIIERPEPVMAMTSKLARRPDVDRRFDSVGITSDNVHPNFWKSYQHNLAALASMLSVSVTFSFHNQYKPVRVLDPVHYADVEANSTFRQANEALTGAYLVKKVSRNLANRQFVTMVELGRESVNQVRA